MTFEAAPTVSSYVALVNAADRTFTWLRPTQPQLSTSLFDTAFAAFQDPDPATKLGVIVKLTDIVFELLEKAQQAESITGHATPADGDDTVQEVTKSFSEFCAEIDEVLMAFIHEAQDHPETFKTIISKIKGDRSCADVRLRTLMYAFNSHEATSPFKASLFLDVINFAAEVNLLDVAVIPVLTKARAWVDHWAISVAEKRNICAAVAKNLSSSDNAAQAYAWKLKSIKYYGVEDREKIDTKLEFSFHKCRHAFLRTAAQAAADTLSDAIRLPTIFYFDDLMSLYAIKLLKSAPEYKALYTLGEALFKKTVQDVAQILKHNPNLLSTFNLDAEACLRKIRVIAVAAEASNQAADDCASLSTRRSMRISVLAKSVGLSEVETEEAAVSGVGHGLFIAKLDQLNKTIEIESAMRREFTLADWDKLKARIVQWQDGIHQMSTLLSSSTAPQRVDV